MNSPMLLDQSQTQRRPVPVVGQSKASAAAPVQNLLDQLAANARLSGFGMDIQSIAALTETGDRAVHVLARAVLAEPFIAQKLIRAANVVRDLRGSSQVTTISKAIVLLGLEQVRALVLSTLPVDRLKNREQAGRVREECSQSLYAAVLARELAVGRAGIEPEEAAVCTLFRGYGRVMAAVYLHQAYEQALVLSQEQGIGAATAAARTLGMGFDQLGVEVLARCGMPERIVQAAYRCPAHVRPSTSLQINLRMLAEFCGEITEAVREPEQIVRHQQIEALLDHFGRALGVGRKGLTEALRVTDHHTRERGREAGAAGRTTTREFYDENNPLTLSPSNRPGPSLTLGAGVASLSRMLERGEPPEARLKHATDVLQRAYGFQRVILCLKDPATGVFRARIVSGRMPDTTETAFGLREIGHHDLFNAVVWQGADIYIRDATDTKLQPNLPSWFKLTCPDAKSFLLLSIGDDGGPLGFFYADHARTNAPGLTSEEVKLIKVLKQQTWVAVRQEQGAQPVSAS